jgi:hypothetical protein
MSVSFFVYEQHHDRPLLTDLNNLEAPLENAILSSISAPPAHKAKLLVELYALRHQQECLLAHLNKTLEHPKCVISSEEIYLQNIGEDNRTIKHIEDELRKLFVKENLEPAEVKKGNDLLVNVYELYLEVHQIQFC